MWASGARFEDKLNRYENNPLYSPQLSMALGGVNGTNETTLRAPSEGSASKPVLELPMQTRPGESTGGTAAGDRSVETS